MQIKTDIIPYKQQFANTNNSSDLNLEAICVFSAIGFFLDTDTYYKNKIVLPAASINQLNENKLFKSSKSYFSWHYSPRSITFKQALDEFSSLFENIINEQTQNKKILLPISGGLDSRTQATALIDKNEDVFAYSYQFENGFRETKIAQEIAQVSKFKFQAFTIPKGYLWNEINELFNLNKGYSDFTAPRQMAVKKDLIGKGDVLSLGHWGDVLFDSMNLPQLSNDEAVHVLIKKLIKKGGLQFAEDLWKEWSLKGTFLDYITNRVYKLLTQIKIDDTNAKIRAFKSKYWAPRWTSVNLSVFEKIAPISLPYYDNRMCEFICTIPEEYLKNRQLQIAYIKQKTPKLASITWQDAKPFNLYSYKYNKLPYNLPYRIFGKLQREYNKLNGKKYTQRNWELQFLGEENNLKLTNYLLNNATDFINAQFLKTYLKKFQENPEQNAHAINMLLPIISKISQK